MALSKVAPNFELSTERFLRWHLNCQHENERHTIPETYWNISWKSVHTFFVEYLASNIFRNVKFGIFIKNNKKKWAHVHFSMCMLSGEHVQTSWACEHLHFSMCTLLGEHVYAFRWACACFQLSMCTSSGEHVHAFSWACAHLHLSMCTLSLALEGFLWAYARFQLSIWTLSVEHVQAYSWVCACFQLSMCTLSVEHAHSYT